MFIGHVLLVIDEILVGVVMSMMVTLGHWTVIVLTSSRIDVAPVVMMA